MTDTRLYYDPADFDAEVLVQFEDRLGSIEIPDCDEQYLRCVLRVFREECQPVVRLLIDCQKVPVALGHRLAAPAVVPPLLDAYGDLIFDDDFDAEEDGAGND